MEWNDVANVVKKSAPLLGSLLGPAGTATGAGVSTAIGLVQKAFGLGGDSTPDEVSAAIQANPESALKLKQIENDNEQFLAKLSFERDMAELKDMQSARDRDVRLHEAGYDNKRADDMLKAAFLAVIAIAIVLAMVPGLAGQVVGFLVTIGGMFARNIGTAFDFEFGSSRSSKSKDNLIAFPVADKLRKSA